MLTKQNRFLNMSVPLCSLIDAETKFFHHLFSHSEFLNLTGYGHRKLGSEPYETGNLVCCDFAATVVTDFILSGVLTLAQPNPRANLFAIFFVGNTDNLDVADLGMCV